MTKNSIIGLLAVACSFIAVVFTARAAKAPSKKIDVMQYDPLLTFVFEHERYDWQNPRTLMWIDADVRKAPAAVLKDKRVMEYVYDENENLKIYETVHKIIRVNTDEAVRQYNKVYIPMHNALSVITLKARFIHPSGRIVNVNEQNIMELESSANAGAFRIFAIEGAEKGGELEYVYTLERLPSFFGRETFQGNAPARDIELEIITPSNLIFEAKSYNGFPQMRLLENRYPGKHSLLVKAPQVPAMSREAYTFTAANLMRIDYKLAYDRLLNGHQRLLTWNEAAVRIQDNILGGFQHFPEEDFNALNHLLNNLLKPVGKDINARIKAIDNYVKHNIAVNDNFSTEIYSPADIIRYKTAKGMDVVRLYSLLFAMADIDYEVVLTTDRSGARFDGHFESWYSLEQHLFYFASTNRFLDPVHQEYPYGIIPYLFTGNQGLFISMPINGGEPVAQVREIPTTDYLSNRDDTEMLVCIQGGVASVSTHRNLTGYNAVALRHFLRQTSVEAHREVFHNIFQLLDTDATLEHLYLHRPDEVDGSVAYNAELKLPSLIEDAGNLMLVRIGALIGKQPEPVADQTRTTDVETDFNRIFTHHIGIEIPEGYTLRNDYKTLNRELVYRNQQGELLMQFRVHAHTTGSKLLIDVEEFYTQLNYPSSDIAQISKVMNAAWEFNNAVIVLEKNANTVKR